MFGAIPIRANSVHAFARNPMIKAIPATRRLRCHIRFHAGAPYISYHKASGLT